MGDVSGLQQSMSALIESAFARRHREEGTQDGQSDLPFPFSWGGTFGDIAARAWKDPSVFLPAAIRTLYRTKFLSDEMPVDDFAAAYCRLKDH